MVYAVHMWTLWLRWTLGMSGVQREWSGASARLVTPIAVAVDEHRCVELFDVTAKASDVVAVMCSFDPTEE
jgi:hypothetical protein